MEPELTTNPEAPDSEEARAKAFIFTECENSVAAGVTFVAVRFDGYGDSIVTKEVGFLTGSGAHGKTRPPFRSLN